MDILSPPSKNHEIAYAKRKEKTKKNNL